MGGRMKKLGIALVVFLVGLAAFAQQQQQPTPFQQIGLLLQNPPSSPSNLTIQQVGAPGSSSTVYYYWVVANYPIGKSSPAGPIVGFNANSTLNSSNYFTIFWQTAPGATSYDVLRSTVNQTPTGACACAVATGVSGTSQNDQSNTLSAYTVATLTPNNFTNVLSTQAVSSNKADLFLYQNGVQIADLSTGAGPGSITQITAGTDLTGGGTSGNVTLALANPIHSATTGNAATATAFAAAPSLCTSGQAAQGVLASGNATGCFTPSGAGTITGVTPTAGGGLAGGGTSGGVTLGLLTTCSSGQVLQWNGSAWACATSSGTVTGATSGGGLVLSSTTLGLLTSCSTNQVEQWNGTSWVCASVTATSLAWSSLLPPTGNLNIAMPAGDLTEFDYPSEAGSPTTGAYFIKGTDATGVDTSTIGAYDTVAGSHQNSFRAGITGTNQLQICWQPGPQGQTVIGSAVACPAISNSPFAKSVFMSSTAAHTINRLWQSSAAATGDMNEWNTASSGTGFYYLKMFSGVTSTDTSSGGGTLIASIRGDGLFTGIFNGPLTGAVTGNASTATALATTPSLCGAGQAAQGVLASGNATGCFTPTGSGTVNNANQFATPYYSAAGSAATLSGVAPPTTNGVYVVGYNITSGVASAPIVTQGGVNVDAQTGTYTLACPTDRLGEVEFNISSAATLNVPQAGSTTCLQTNPAFVVRNAKISTAILTITTATSTFLPESVSSLTVLPGGAFFVYSDATTSTGNWHAIPVSKAYGGVNIQTTSYTMTAIDKDKMVIMNCSSACTVTFPAAPPNADWNIHLMSIGSTTATVSLNSLTYNASASVPVLVRYMPLTIGTDGSNYLGGAPLVAGAGVSITPATNGATIAFAGTADQIAAPRACAAASASGTTYTCTTSPTFVPAAHDEILFKADVASTGAVTINVNSSSAAPAKKQGGGTALVANDLLIGQWVPFIFDGTNWQMEGPTGNAAAGGGVSSLTGDTTLFNNAASTGATTLTPTSQSPNTVFMGPASVPGAAAAAGTMVAAPPPITFCDPRAWVCEYDDFDYSAVASQWGRMGWTSAGTTPAVGYVSNQTGTTAWGVVKCTTNAGATNFCTLTNSATGSGGFWGTINSNTSGDFLFRFKLGSATIANQNVFLGLIDVNTGHGETSPSYLGLAFKGTDTTWMCVESNSSSATRTAMTGGTATPNTAWHTARIRITSAAHASCSIDNGTETALTTGNFPTSTNMTQQWEIDNNGTANAMELDADYYFMQLPITR